MHAVIDQANPSTILTRYEAIAAAGQKMVQTDVPQSVLPAFVDLALRVRNGTLSRLLFVNGKDGFTSAQPDYALVRRRVAAALKASAASSASPSASATAQPSQSSTSTATPSASPTASVSATVTPSATTSATATASSSDDASQVGESNVSDACAYHPVATASATPSR